MTQNLGYTLPAISATKVRRHFLFENDPDQQPAIF
jgi:hypothetical protein